MTMAAKGPDEDNEPENGAPRRIAQQTPPVTILSRHPTPEQAAKPATMEEDADMGEAGEDTHPQQTDNTEQEL
jgi:hypothetical protein